MVLIIFMKMMSRPFFITILSVITLSIWILLLLWLQLLLLDFILHITVVWILPLWLNLLLLIPVRRSCVVMLRMSWKSRIDSILPTCWAVYRCCSWGCNPTSTILIETILISSSWIRSSEIWLKSFTIIIFIIINSCWRGITYLMIRGLIIRIQ